MLSDHHCKVGSQNTEYSTTIGFAVQCVAHVTVLHTPLPAVPVNLIGSWQTDIQYIISPTTYFLWECHYRFCVFDTFPVQVLSEVESLLLATPLQETKVVVYYLHTML